MGVVTRDVKSISKSGDTPLKGDVTLTAGSNISLTQSGQDISIAATGGGGGTLTTIKEGGTQVGDADIGTLDFDGSDFNLTESPDTEVNIVIEDSGIDHDSTTNFVANEHIDHTGVTLTAGDGLSGGGDISANRTFAVDLNELGTETTIAAGDFISMVDITDNGSQKITFANLEGALDHNSLTNTHNLTTDIDHDALTNFVANEHIDWTSASSNFDTSGTLSVSGTHIALDGTATELRFYEGANYVGFEAPTLTGDQIWVLPSADGTSGQALTTDGTGTLSWSDAGSSSPLTTKGDIYTYDTDNARLPVGTDGDHLIADSGETTGLLWKAETDANGNVKYGTTALNALTTGVGNTALGYNAGIGVTTGSNNTALGYSALVTEDTTDGSVAVGYQALSQQNGGINTAVGYQAGALITLGTYNTILGYGALDAETTGADNTAVGYNALGAQNTTDGNTAVGSGAGESITTSSGNVIMGASALASETTGGANTAIGLSALTASNGGTYNTAIGNGAGVSVTTGDYNTILGGAAATNITTGSSNIIIGQGISPDSATADNQLNIGGLIHGDLTGWMGLKDFDELRFYDDGANYVGFEAPALTADQIWVLPSADGSADQVLKTDGAGNLGWATAGGGGKEKSIQVSSAFVDLSTGDNKALIKLMDEYNGMDLVDVTAEVTTAPTGSTISIQIRNATDSVDILSTPITIDAGETSSETAATAPVIDTANDDIATNDLIAIDVDSVGSTTPGRGLVIGLRFA